MTANKASGAGNQYFNDNNFLSLAMLMAALLVVMGIMGIHLSLDGIFDQRLLIDQYQYNCLINV